MASCVIESVEDLFETSRSPVIRDPWPRRQDDQGKLTLARRHSTTATTTKFMPVGTLLNSPRGNACFRSRSLSGSSSPESSNMAANLNSSPTNRMPISSGRYKTELCRPFLESGTCKYGDKCQFAHGQSELRQLVRHPKYKTELCRTFHTLGFCPYGLRCHFIHDGEERRCVLKAKTFVLSASGANTGSTGSNELSSSSAGSGFPVQRSGSSSSSDSVFPDRCASPTGVDPSGSFLDLYSAATSKWDLADAINTVPDVLEWPYGLQEADEHDLKSQVTSPFGLPALLILEDPKYREHGHYDDVDGFYQDELVIDQPPLGKLHHIY